MIGALMQEFLREDEYGGHSVRGAVTGRVDTARGPFWVTCWRSQTPGGGDGDADVYDDPRDADWNFLEVVRGMELHGWRAVGGAERFVVEPPAAGDGALEWAHRALLPTLPALGAAA